MPLRSQLMRSHQRINSGAPPDGLLLPLGLHLISCLLRPSVSILQTWPNHWRNLCLSCSSTGNTPVLSQMSVFLTLFHKVIPKISCRHLIWEDFSLRMYCWVTFHVLAPYRSTGITRVWWACTLVAMLMSRLWKIFLRHIWYALPAFSSLINTSFSALLDWLISLPR